MVFDLINKLQLINVLKYLSSMQRQLDLMLEDLWLVSGAIDHLQVDEDDYR